MVRLSRLLPTTPSTLNDSRCLRTAIPLGLLVALLGFGCASAPADPSATAAAETAAAEEAPAAEETPAAENSPIAEAEPCANGVIKEDGKTDLGYSFIPSSTEAIYLQKFDSSELPAQRVDTVCVCFFQKPGGSDADFEVVFHRDGGGGPQLEPYKIIPALATTLGQGRDDAKLYAIDVGGVEIPEGPFYVGARWNPSQEVRLFICADHSPETAEVPGFYKDDRQQGWRSVFNNPDPTFANHRSLLVRVETRED